MRRSSKRQVRLCTSGCKSEKMFGVRTELLQNTQRLERVQRSAARLIAGVSVTDHLPHDILLARAGLETLARRWDMILVAPVYRLTRQTPSGPRHLCEAFERWKAEAPSSRCSMPLRSAELHHVRLPRPRTELLRRSPFYRAVSLLNSFPLEVKATWSPLKSAILSFSKLLFFLFFYFFFRQCV